MRDQGLLKWVKTSAFVSKFCFNVSSIFTIIHGVALNTETHLLSSIRSLSIFMIIILPL